MTESNSPPIPVRHRWIVGQWDQLHLARAAQVGLIVAIRRGLGVIRAMELARETARDPVTIRLGENHAPEWLSETYNVHPPRGWSLEIKQRANAHWRLKVQVEPRTYNQAAAEAEALF